ncbi:MAG: hypothetical protein R3274_04300 [Desulfobacterales bacterium]|nr:hypothetical protein [Desulfobacterales bacterium]
MQNPKESQSSPDALDPASGVQLLTQLIEAAKHMLLNPPVESKAYAAWNDQTKAHLIRVYGAGSPNIDTITEATGRAPAWLFMPKDVAEKYVASSLEEKIQRLESCVVALKRKARQMT